MVFNILILTIVLITTSSNFFYNNYSIKHFIILNRLMPIKTAKNIVIFINNNTFAYSFTGNIKPGNTEPSISRYSNKEFVANINLNKLVNIKNLIINIGFFNCYFNDNR